MTMFVLNEQNRKKTLDEILRLPTGGLMEIVDKQGTLVATLILAADPVSAARAASLTEEELAELRRRRASPREHDITTAELLEYLRHLEESGK